MGNEHAIIKDLKNGDTDEQILSRHHVTDKTLSEIKVRNSLPDRGVDAIFIEDVLDNDGEEIWHHNRTGKIICVYERCDVYVRYHENYKPDMQEQGHAQLPWNLFNKTHTLLGKLDKK